MTTQRKKYPPEKKVEILRKHMKNKMSVSEVKKLKDRLQKKDDVISWLTEENITLKKTFGDL